MLPLMYSSKEGAGDDKNHSNELPSLPGSVNTVLLVDDIIDTGKTTQEIVEFYRDQGVKVITAVFHYKEGAVIAPDLYYWRIPKDSEFINYPYELT